jgi:hypothetical protein
LIVSLPHERAEDGGLLIQKMAGVLGIEPRNGGTKNRCLTAWLHPNICAGDAIIGLWRFIGRFMQNPATKVVTLYKKFMRRARCKRGAAVNLAGAFILRNLYIRQVKTAYLLGGGGSGAVVWPRRLSRAAGRGESFDADPAIACL